MNNRIVKIFLLIVILVVFISSLYFFFIKNSAGQSSVSNRIEGNQEGVSITSTDPTPLDNIIITEKQIIKINFSNPLENVGELKYQLEPKIDLKIELSPDRKTAIFTPIKQFNLGTTYTLFIKPDSKFDGGKRLDGDKVYHFKTVTFRGF